MTRRSLTSQELVASANRKLHRQPDSPDRWTPKEGEHLDLCHLFNMLDVIPDKSAFRDINGEAAARGFFVLGHHILSCLAHGLNHFIERHMVLAVSLHG